MSVYGDRERLEDAKKIVQEYEVKWQAYLKTLSFNRLLDCYGYSIWGTLEHHRQVVAALEGKLR